VKVTYVSSLPAGGPLSHVRDLAPAVAAEGVDVNLVCADDLIAAEFRAMGIEAEVVPLRDKYDVKNGARLPALLRSADVVHSHDRRAGLYARLAARAVGSRAVHTLHGVPDEIFAMVGRVDPPAPPGVSSARIAWLRFGLMRIEALLSHLGAVVVPSHALARFLAEHGFPRRRMHVIPYGVAARRHAPAPLHDPPRLGTAAILEQRKGIDVLLDAQAAMQRPAQLDVFGDGSLRHELEGQAGRLGISVRFHGFLGDLRDRLPELDVFVLPTRADNLPVAILEAMAVGLPVVATRVGGVPELVVDGETGYLVAPDDPRELGRALDAVISDPTRHRQMGEAGAARVAAHFEARAIAARMVRLYEQLLRPPPS
jgi:glycosyltransferase involved in cell wall biosynthesis